jgi:CubicO group peptidase (beta-lactamase class C family)
MKIKSAFFFLLTSLLARAQEPLPAKLDSYMQDQVKATGFSGNVLVAKHGAIIFKKSYGLADREKNIPNNPHTKFWIGSVSKQFTTAAILILEQEGKLSVQDKLSKYYPFFPNADRITLHLLMCNRSGIDDFTNDYHDLGKRPSKKWIASEPDQKFIYSNANFILLSNIIEKVSGQKYGNFIDDKIFKPLGMKQSGSCYYSDTMNNAAKCYQPSRNGFKRGLIINSELTGGAGGLYSTLDDLYKWNMSMLGSKILSGNSRKKMLTPYSTDEYYGYGIGVDTIVGKRMFGHSGKLGGYLTDNMTFFEDSTDIIVFSNSSIRGEIVFDLAKIAFGKQPGLSIDEKIDSLLFKHYTEGFNGNILWASNDSIIFKKSYGFADPKNTIPLNDTSIFMLASMSKQFTAVAILKLYEEGKLKLTDSLRFYFPELPYKGVTVEHLLTHTSGIPDYEEEFVLYKKCSLPIIYNKDLISTYSSLKPKSKFTPGTKWSYSNTNYIILASIIEKLSGLTYKEYLKKYLFDPLEMKHTSVYNTRFSKGDSLPNYAYGCIQMKKSEGYVDGYEPKMCKPYIQYDGLDGDGNVNSTILDLLKWDRGLRENKILSQKTIDQAQRRYKLANGKEADSYGYGVFVYIYERYGRIISHAGAYSGIATIIYRCIDLNKVLIVLCNKTTLKSYSNRQFENCTDKMLFTLLRGSSVKK